MITKQLYDTTLTADDRALLRELTANADPPTASRLRWLKMATSDVDRAGDRLILSGMQSENFLQNPQFLWQHGLSGAQVNTIGSIRRLLPTETALFALAEYATADINPLAEQIYQMEGAGYLPANSIGFRPIEFEENSFGGHTFTKWELIECSKVELPMNPNAVNVPTDAGSISAPSAPEQALSIDQAAGWLCAQ